MRGISKEFPGVKALDDVSFAVWPGEVHMLLGENGAGKSSLMKVLCGAYRADDGRVLSPRREGRNHSTADAQRLGIAVIFQEFSLVPYLDIAQNIFLGREPDGRIPGTDRPPQSLYATPSGCSNHRLRYRSLGDGGKDSASRSSRWSRSPRRVSQNARILVMDEPTAALSDRETELLFALIAG